MKLDIGCGPKKHEGYTGLDLEEHKGVDIVHDIEKTPWPIDDGIVTHVIASHVMEHVKPWKIVGVMNELWRVTKHKCEAEISTPYGDFYRFDPTHCIHFIAPSWWYFDPNYEDYYSVHRPKPWRCMKWENDEKNMVLKVYLRKMEENSWNIRKNCIKEV